MNYLKLICGAIALMLFSASCGGNKQAPMAEASIQKYPTEVLSKQSVELLSTYPATIKGQEDVEIRPRVEGFIDAIYIDEGSVVRNGQALFKVSSPQSEQALTTAQAAMKTAQAQVNTAKTNVNRIRPLVEKDIVSNIQLTTAEDTYQSALAGLAQAEAALKNAEVTMGWTTVSSPVDGIIGEVYFRLGSLVKSADILTTVANTSSVYAYFSLNEKELTNFLNGLEGATQAQKIKNVPDVTLTLADGNVYGKKGRLETITGSINITTGSASFRAEFSNKEGMLRSGTSGKVIIPKHVESAIVIPQKATFSLQDKVVAYLVQSDSVVQKVITTIPTPDGISYVVTDGLSEGDKIVTDGIATLSHGKKIAFE